jgi:hypothetical protein
VGGKAFPPSKKAGRRKVDGFSVNESIWCVSDSDAVLDRAEGGQVWLAMANLLDTEDQNRVLTLLNDTKFELEELSRLVPSSNRPAHKVLDRALVNVTAMVKEMYQRDMPIS